MAHGLFSNFGGVESKYSLDRNFEYAEGGGKQIQCCGAVDWVDLEAFNSFSSDFVFNQDNLEEGFRLRKNQEQQPFSEYGFLDDLRFGAVSPATQKSLERIKDLGDTPIGVWDNVEQEQQLPSSLASIDLINNYGSGFRRLSGEMRFEPTNGKRCKKAVGRGLSTEEIMRVAGTWFIQSSYQSVDALPFPSHPYNMSFSDLSDEEMKDVELAECLLASAEKLGYQQFDCAGRLLNLCDQLSSRTGSTVQRVVYYFTEALRERIRRETGRITSCGGVGKKQSFDFEKAAVTPNLTSLACQTELPFFQVGQFSGIQAIVENAANSRKIHVIDLGLGNGSQWIVLMQALAVRYECPVELLKITAIGITLRESMEDTGKRLKSSAHAMKLPFSFKIVMVSDMVDIKEDIIDIDASEAVAVYSAYVLRTMIAQPNQLESLMRVIRNINPCIMVVTEVEGNHNSPLFVSRFTEALFYFSAYFDCVESCMKTNPNRASVESTYLYEDIKNIIATEGEERSIRHVKMDVWRKYFARFGLKETELSMSSLYQANLVLKRFDCGSSCTINMNGKCLIMGWKGAPLQSLSVWKFG